MIQSRRKRRHQGQCVQGFGRKSCFRFSFPPSIPISYYLSFSSFHFLPFYLVPSLPFPSSLSSLPFFSVRTINHLKKLSCSLPHHFSWGMKAVKIHPLLSTFASVFLAHPSQLSPDRKSKSSPSVSQEQITRTMHM